MPEWIGGLIWIGVAIVLVALNGFFVAAEFALVKVRSTRLDELAREGRAFVGTAQWLVKRMNEALSACQLGITMASLGLGWVGEPAVARLMGPTFEAVGITSAAVVHTLSFAIGFSVITAAHLVIGEQAPKIFAIRQPERMVLWCALPLKWFCLFSFPILMALSGTTNVILRLVGVDATSEHETPHTEQELRLLLGRSRVSGEITRSEHRLIDAVFEFDDTICRQIMVPRVDVVYLDADRPFAEALAVAREGKHSRYPVCAGSMDNVIGVVHIRDLIGLDPDVETDLRTLARAPRYIPETMRISKMLRHFQATRQHLAFIVDEYGSVIGIVTLENVLEKIVGAVEDEFDTETLDIVADGPNRYLVMASTTIDAVNVALDLGLRSDDVDTIGGLLMETLDRVVEKGDKVELPGVTAEVLEIQGSRAVRLRLKLVEEDEAPEGSAEGGR